MGWTCGSPAESLTHTRFDACADFLCDRIIVYSIIYSWNVCTVCYCCMHVSMLMLYLLSVWQGSMFHRAESANEKEILFFELPIYAHVSRTNRFFFFASPPSCRGLLLCSQRCLLGLRISPSSGALGMRQSRSEGTRTPVEFLIHKDCII